MRAFKVLFVCTGNTCRSPMAEAGLKGLLKKAGIENIQVFSAGVSAAPGFAASQYASEAVKMWDLSLKAHLSRPATAELLETMDLILALAPGHYHSVLAIEPEAADRIFLLKNFPTTGSDGEGIDDPMGSSRDVYDRTFLEIAEELGRILPLIVRMANAKATHSGASED